MERMIEVENLVKHFGPIRAVDDVSFSVDSGIVLGFLGPNGAGKSTTMKMITGFLSPTSGSVRVGGFDVAERPIEVKAQIGYLPEGAPAYPDMTPSSFLNFAAEIRGLGPAERPGKIADAVAKVALGEVMQQPIETLSKGFKRRVGLAQAILHDPPVLILDEPTDGLDPNQKHEVRNLIREMARDKAIIISTHILEEVDAVCDRALIIANGRIVADGTPDELAARSDYHNAVTLWTTAAGAAEALAGIADVARVEALRPGVLQIFPKTGAVIAGSVGELAREAGWTIDQMIVESGRLDEVFRRITTADAAEAGGGAP